MHMHHIHASNIYALYSNDTAWGERTKPNVGIWSRNHPHDRQRHETIPRDITTRIHNKVALVHCCTLSLCYLGAETEITEIQISIQRSSGWATLGWLKRAYEVNFTRFRGEGGLVYIVTIFSLI